MRSEGPLHFSAATLFIGSILLCHVCGQVVVINMRSGFKMSEFHDVAASFGQPIPTKGLRGRAVPANPDEGCDSIDPAPEDTEHNLPMFAVIARYGGCNFEQKVRNAQEANYTAVIIYNINSDKLVPMGGDDNTLISSVFIGQSDAKLLLERFSYPMNPEVYLLISDDEPFDINAYLLPFAIVVGICFLVMLCIVVYKCCQDHRRSRRHRLPKSALKKLPIIKYKAGDPYETCVICLDDFVEGDKLRVLPCDHGYHSKCIDPWLVKNKRICPQCRKRVFDRRPDSSDESADEQAPLLSTNSTRQNYTVANSRTTDENDDRGRVRSLSSLYQARAGASNRQRSTRPNPWRRGSSGRNRYQRLEAENIGGREEDERSFRRDTETTADQAINRAEIHARFASDMRPLLEEFGRATAAAATETEAAIDRNNLVDADGRPNADEAEAVAGATATTASVIVHHAAAPDQCAGAEQHMEEKEKVLVDQVAVEIVSSESVIERFSDDEDSSPSPNTQNIV